MKKLSRKIWAGIDKIKAKVSTFISKITETFSGIASKVTESKFAQKLRQKDYKAAVKQVIESVKELDVKKLTRDALEKLNEKVLRHFRSKEDF